MANPAPLPTGTPVTTIWYDGACPLCTREIAWMRRLDRRGRLNFIDVSNEDTSCPANRAEMLARFHAEEEGKIVTGAAAFAAMWRQIPLLRPIGLAARNRMVLALLETTYRGYLKIRPSLQRLVRRIDRPVGQRR